MSIITPPPDTVAYVYKVLAELINASWQKADTKQSEFETKIANAQSSFLDTTTAPTISADLIVAPVVSEPEVAIPTEVDGDAFNTFDTKYIELGEWLAGKFTDFKATHFPDESTSYAAAEAWLEAAIANPDAGLPPSVAAQIWESDRSRIALEAQRATDDVLAEFAMRRFAVPPGAATAAAVEIQKKAQAETAASSHRVAEMSVDMQKFSVSALMQLRQSAMGACLDYIKSLASGPDVASRVVGIGYDAQSKLISAVSDFYRARISAQELSTKASQFNVQMGLEAASKNQAAELTLIEDKLKALLAEAQTIGQAAVSLYNNLHAQAQATGSDSVQTRV